MIKLSRNTTKMFSVRILFVVLLLCIVCHVPNTEGRGIHHEYSKRATTGEGSVNLVEYLTQYGYMGQRPPGVPASPEDINLALAELQRFAGLEVTGIMNEETQQLLAQDRCGVKDVIGSVQMSHNKVKRYNTYDLKWSRNDLTYYITNYTPDLNQQTVRNIMYRAFKVWADVSPLTFTEARDSNSADIVIKFGAGRHDDPYAPFDGEGGTLAHAYFPEDGDAHFDEDETWTEGTNEGINLFFVAAHEFGHSLGLSHSDINEALMYPWYQGYIPNFQLPEDDRLGIQYLYGMPDVSKETPALSPGNATPRPKPGRPDTCTSSWDAVMLGPDSKTYAFKGRYYWLIEDDKVAKGYPKGTHRLFGEDVPTKIQAAVTSRRSRKTYLFKGFQVWRYTNFQLDPGFPVDAVARGLPKGPLTAFVWGANGEIYIFKGNKYYIMEENKIDPEYVRTAVRPAKKIKQKWKGVPSQVDGALQWKNGKTFFFRGDEYWRFNDSKRKVDKHYPKSKALYWMGCERGNQPLPERIEVAPSGQGR